MKITAEPTEPVQVWAQFTEPLNRDGLKVYSWKLLFMAILGYVYLSALLLALIAVILWLGLSKNDLTFLMKEYNLLFIVLPVVFVTRQLLRIDVPEVTGYLLDKNDFDRLYKMVSRLQHKLNTPVIEKIILVPEFNAAITQILPSGILARKKYTLIIGLDLMMATTPEQLTAIVAHELGHLSRNYGCTTAWVYRICTAWFSILHALGQVNGWRGRIMRCFLNRYFGYYSTGYFILARHNEYQADTLAAEVISAEWIASALLYTDVLARYSDEAYWQKISLRANDQSQPPKKVYEGLYDFYKKGITDEMLKQRYIDQAYGVETRDNDTHPALQDRLIALRIQPTDINLIEKNAAACFLGNKIKTVVKYFSAQWFEQQKQAWQERYEYAQVIQNRLKVLIRQHEQQALVGEDLWQLAELTEALVSAALARPLYQSYFANQ